MFWGCEFRRWVRLFVNAVIAAVFVLVCFFLSQLASDLIVVSWMLPLPHASGLSVLRLR